MTLCYNSALALNAPVAQLDRVLVSEAKGHRFDSCRARHLVGYPLILSAPAPSHACVLSLYYSINTMSYI